MGPNAKWRAEQVLGTVGRPAASNLPEPRTFYVETPAITGSQIDATRARDSIDPACRHPHRRFSSGSVDVTVGTDYEELGKGVNAGDEGVGLRPPAVPVRAGQDGRVDWPGELLLGALEGFVEVGIGELVGHHQRSLARILRDTVLQNRNRLL